MSLLKYPSSNIHECASLRRASTGAAREACRAVWPLLLAAGLLAGCAENRCADRACGDAGPATAMDAAAADTGAPEPDAQAPDAQAPDAQAPDAQAPDASSEADAGAVVPDETVAWVLAYFGPSQTVEADSLHLAYSEDGLHWTALGEAPAYVVSGIGTNHIRDPFLLRRDDGTFVYLATDWTLVEDGPDYWNRPSPRIFVAESEDLIEFTNPHLLTVTELEGPSGTAMHAWAPEAFYDSARGQYAILWSGNDTTGQNRIYVNYTRDFESVDSLVPQVFFDPGYTVIDGTLVSDGAQHYLVFKDARDGVQDVQIARSSSLEPRSFVRWSPNYIVRGADQGTPRTTEGPFVVRIADRWVMCADYYLRGGIFGCWSTTSLDADPATWVELSPLDFSFPIGVRHASTVRVSQRQLDALRAHYGVVEECRLRTLHEQDGQVFYAAHSWFHGIITPREEAATRGALNDLRWRLRPGLANPEDPDLVSIEPAGFPGHYLHVDGANLSRYPACDEPSVRGEALCWPGVDRTYLTWIDAEVDSPEFAEDATFRRVAALNGDPAMVSFQWVGDPSLYLRHEFYQLFLRPGGTTEEAANAASFAIEPL